MQIGLPGVDKLAYTYISFKLVAAKHGAGLGSRSADWIEKR
jgi:hypothetical protein